VKIVDRKTFLAMPGEVLFSKYTPRLTPLQRGRDRSDRDGFSEFAARRAGSDRSR
jgi:hypothetical protein